MFLLHEMSEKMFILRIINHLLLKANFKLCWSSSGLALSDHKQLFVIMENSQFYLLFPPKSQIIDLV